MSQEQPVNNNIISQETNSGTVISPVTTLPSYSVEKKHENDFDDIKIKKEKPWWKKWVHLASWILMTAYFIAAMVLKGPSESIPLIFLYIFISFKLLFYHVSTSLISKPVGKFWDTAVNRPLKKIPKIVKNILGVLIPVAIMVAVAMGSPETDKGNRLQRLISMCGLIVFIAILYITSTKRKNVNWRIVVVGIFLQFLLGIFILKTTVGYELFKWLADLASTFLEFSKQGAIFVLGKETAESQTFATNVLPGVLFFASFIQIVYYLGGMQWVIKKFAWVMVRLMDTSGSESVVAAASPFVGQGESALLVKPFIKDMTMSELHSTMTSGFATIAGSVLIAFISFGIDPQSLITACVMSTPCSLVVSKLRVPETEESVSKGNVHIPEDEDRESNALHAAANGAAQGLKLIGLIAATLVAVISLLALVNAILTYLGSFLGINELTLPLIASYIFIPFAWLIGIPAQDVQKVGELMATKMFVNEFAAYLILKDIKDTLSVRAQLLTTYALCGFANFASVGIQIGCIGAMAPSRKSDLAKLAVSAMFCGTLSTFITATISGMLI